MSWKGESKIWICSLIWVEAGGQSPEKLNLENLVFSTYPFFRCLHREALVDLKAFGARLQSQIAEISAKDPEKAEELTEAVQRTTERVMRRISTSQRR